MTLKADDVASSEQLERANAIHVLRACDPIFQHDASALAARLPG